MVLFHQPVGQPTGFICMDMAMRLHFLAVALGSFFCFGSGKTICNA